MFSFLVDIPKLIFETRLSDASLIISFRAFLEPEIGVEFQGTWDECGGDMDPFCFPWGVVGWNLDGDLAILASCGEAIRSSKQLRPPTKDVVSCRLEPSPGLSFHGRVSFSSAGLECRSTDFPLPESRADSRGSSSIWNMRSPVDCLDLSSGLP